MIDREKVIKGLEKAVEVFDGRISGPMFEMWIDETKDALALLKAQEPCEDWISRKRLKDEIQYYIDEAGWSEEVNKALGWCLEFIDNQREVTWNDL